MRHGRIEQVGTPDEVYERPASVFVAQFIGAPTMNLVPARLEGDGGRPLVRLPGGLDLPLPEVRAAALSPGARGDVLAGIRPEDLHWARENGAAHGGTVFEVTADLLEPLGSDTLVFFSLGPHEVVARVPPKAIRRAGERLRLEAETAALHLFDPQTERAL
jgi:multiple sugar transport system ATP-binding protein